MVGGRFARMIAPAAAVSVVIAGVSAAAHHTGGALPELPTRTASQLVAALAEPRVPGISGTVEITADFGLPFVPPLGVQPAGQVVTKLLSGTHTVRVWASSKGFRAQILDQLDETEIVANTTTLWVYSYSGNSVTHFPLTRLHGLGELFTSTQPDAFTRRLLSTLASTTSVQTAGTTSVAGRAAYVLTLTPTDANTSVGHIEVDLDAATQVVLRVAIFPKDSANPALTTAFRSVSFGPVASSRFAFTPPPGSGGTSPPGASAEPGAVPPRPQQERSTPSSSALSAHHGPEFLGNGWSTITVLAATSGIAEGIASAVSYYGEPVPGGVLLATPLLSFAVADGNLYVGAVTSSAMRAALKVGRP
ncbi:MAG: hypothetical protein K6T28_07280 [Acidothermus sp.]|nr:hypothetical protein [Acidothermus sp.]